MKFSLFIEDNMTDVDVSVVAIKLFSWSTLVLAIDVKLSEESRRLFVTFEQLKPFELSTSLMSISTRVVNIKKGEFNKAARMTTVIKSLAAVLGVENVFPS